MKKKQVLVIDNYDSFVYNLVHYLEAFDTAVSVIRNDEIQRKILKNFDSIVLSPGPGLPQEAGQLVEVLRDIAVEKKILGVCLGHQALGGLFGAQLRNLSEVHHGVSSFIELRERDGIFSGLPPKIEVGRYHSWVVEDLPNNLIATSYDERGNLMSFRHQSLRLQAVQFHPESVLTPCGKKIIGNWLNLP